jgi:hypothetical protein
MDFQDILISVCVISSVILLIYRLYQITSKEKEKIIKPFIYMIIATMIHSFIFIFYLLNVREPIFIILNLYGILMGLVHLLMLIVEIIVIMLVPLGVSHYDPNK